MNHLCVIRRRAPRSAPDAAPSGGAGGRPRSPVAAPRPCGRLTRSSRIWAPGRCPARARPRRTSPAAAGPRAASLAPCAGPRPPASALVKRYVAEPDSELVRTRWESRGLVHLPPGVRRDDAGGGDHRGSGCDPSGAGGVARVQRRRGRPAPRRARRRARSRPASSAASIRCTSRPRWCFRARTSRSAPGTGACTPPPGPRDPSRFQRRWPEAHRPFRRSIRLPGVVRREVSVPVTETLASRGPRVHAADRPCCGRWY